MKPIYAPSVDSQSECKDNDYQYHDNVPFEGYFKQEVFPGINLGGLNMNTGEYFSIDFQHPGKSFEFAFILDGHARCSFDKSSLKPLELKSKTAAIHSFPDMPGKFEVSAESNVQMLGIEIESEVLKSILKDYEELSPDLCKALTSDSAPFFRESRTATPMQSAVIRQLITCPFAGLARSLFIQSKVLELISYQIVLFSDDTRPKNPYFISADDEERIRYAREILKTEMTDPPNLIELSKLAGLGVGKLKKGFKAVYGKSAFNCLHEDRMERAHHLLSERRMNVSEVAWEVGYINVGHFGSAFYKQFGIRPKDFQLSCS